MKKKEVEKEIDVLGRKVKEKDLKAALKDVIDTRGLETMLTIDRKMAKEEEHLSMKGDQVMYKYAFF